MGTITLLLGIHNHQPDGNFDEVFASGYEDCYARILSAVEEAPHVKLSLHHTGALLEWIERERPDYFRRMKALVDGGQVEVLGGAFYEPMLAVLPDRDARGQIAMMSDYTERHFGVRPDGMWLAERVWEPSLPSLLASAGVRYTLIDDGHFRYAGEGGPLQGYYVTEKAGSPIAIFPIDQKLRYAIPFQEPGEAMASVLSLREAHGDRDVVVTYGDDGEKFGMWPGTREWVWDKGWLREFFRLLGERAGEVRTNHFGAVLRSTPPSGRIYLPTASYEEMGEWALPEAAQLRYHDVRHAIEARGELEAARAFLRGGIWQGFLSKYPEANSMHKKMLAVSSKVASAIAAAPGHSDENSLMTRELYRAQCNCSYWHGLFGGLYLNYLRDAVYKHLLVAEAFADAALGLPAPSWATGRPEGHPPELFVEERDIDADLELETFIQTPMLDVVIRPQEGAAVQELGYRAKTFMLSNVLARHPEAYHARLREYAARLASGLHDDGGQQPKSIHDVVKVKEPGLEKHLVYDRYSRHCFIDHFLAIDASLDGFAAGVGELGDFVAARYESATPRGDEQARYTRTGRVAGKGVCIEKTYRVRGARIEVRYRISAAGAWDGGLDVVFAPELSLTLLDGHSQERVYSVAGQELSPSDRVLTSRGAWSDVSSLSLTNYANGFRVSLRLDANGASARPSVWRFPLETVSMSEAGFERTYQGSVLVPLFPIHLDGGAASVAVELGLSIELHDLADARDSTNIQDPGSRNQD